MRILRVWSVGLALAALSASVAAQGEYEIGPGDTVRVEVPGQAGLTGEFPVDADGMMFFPYIGRVLASGLKPLELERKLTTLLSDGYLKNPRVIVSMQEFRSKKVYVTGQVQRPGAQGLRANASLLNLLSDVGGVTADAGHEVIVVRPPQLEPEAVEGAAESAVESDEPVSQDKDAGDDPSPRPTPTPDPTLAALPGWVPGAEVFHVSLRELRSGNPDKDLVLQEGDTVYVPRYSQIYVTGQVMRPGAIRYEEGMTVFQAITLAGGPNDRGSSKVKIVRLVDGKRKETRVEMGDVLEPEDTVRIPEKFF